MSYFEILDVSSAGTSVAPRPISMPSALEILIYNIVYVATSFFGNNIDNELMEIKGLVNAIGAEEEVSALPLIGLDGKNTADKSTHNDAAKAIHNLAKKTQSSVEYILRYFASS